MKKEQKYQQSGEGWGAEISVTNKSLWEAKVNKIFIAGCGLKKSQSNGKLNFEGPQKSPW